MESTIIIIQDQIKRLSDEYKKYPIHNDWQEEEKRKLAIAEMEGAIRLLKRVRSFLNFISDFSESDDDD